jgi:hypothetical protein
MSQITTPVALGIRPGDRVKISGDTNRMRRVVAGIGKTESATSFRTLLFIRPSKGYRRCVRRRKAAKRAHAD